MNLEAFAVVTDANDRVLLVPAADEWDLPGGPVPPTEALEAAVMRLVKETTGSDVAVGPLTGVYQQPAAQRLVLVFRVEPLAGTVETGRWATIAETIALVKPAIALRVRDAFRYRDRAFLRLQ